VRYTTPLSALSLPPQPVRAAWWQPALWIRASFEPQIIEIIPACFLSTHALSVGWDLYVRAVASGVVGCCRWMAWLLKYKISEILHRKERKVKVTMSLRPLR